MDSTHKPHDCRDYARIGCIRQGCSLTFRNCFCRAKAHLFAIHTNDAGNEESDSDDMVNSFLNKARRASQANPMCLELKPTRSITIQQLEAEAYGIIAAYRMVEAKTKQVMVMDTGDSFNEGQWVALRRLHEICYNELFDFMLASQHPSATGNILNAAGALQIPKHFWDDFMRFCLLVRNRKKDGNSSEHLRYHCHRSADLSATIALYVPRYANEFNTIQGRIYQYLSEEIPGERELWGPLAVSNYLKVADAEGELASVSYFRLASCYPSFSIQHYFYLMKATYLQNGEEAAHATLDKLILRACYPEHSKKSKEEAVPESLDGQFLSVVCRIIGYYKPDESSRKAESLLVKSALEASQKSKLAGPFFVVSLVITILLFEPDIPCGGAAKRTRPPYFIMDEKACRKIIELARELFRQMLSVGVNSSSLSVCVVLMVLLHHITGQKEMTDRFMSIFPFNEMRTILNVIAYRKYQWTGNGGGCKALESAGHTGNGKPDGVALAKGPVKDDEAQRADVLHHNAPEEDVKKEKTESSDSGATTRADTKEDGRGGEEEEVTNGRVPVEDAAAAEVLWFLKRLSKDGKIPPELHAVYGFDWAAVGLDPNMMDHVTPGDVTRFTERDNLSEAREGLVLRLGVLIAREGKTPLRWNVRDKSFRLENAAGNVIDDAVPHADVEPPILQVGPVEDDTTTNSSGKDTPAETTGRDDGDWAGLKGINSASELLQRKEKGAPAGENLKRSVLRDLLEVAPAKESGETVRQGQNQTPKTLNADGAPKVRFERLSSEKPGPAEKGGEEAPGGDEGDSTTLEVGGEEQASGGAGVPAEVEAAWAALAGRWPVLSRSSAVLVPSLIVLVGFAMLAAFALQAAGIALIFLLGLTVETIWKLAAFIVIVGLFVAASAGVCVTSWLIVNFV